MAERIKTLELLLKPNDIPMECFDIEDEDSELKENEIIYNQNSDNEIVDHKQIEESSDSELENVIIIIILHLL